MTTIRLTEYQQSQLTLSRADEEYLRASFGQTFDIGARQHVGSRL